jgi:membrane fusion protein (multidrug efflux system)
VLLQLNTDLLKAAFDQAAAQDKLCSLRYRRVKNLHKDGAATDRELDQAEADLATSSAALAAAKAQPDRAIISAPIEGFLNKLHVEEGEYLQPGMPVAELVDLATANIVLHVPERSISFLELNDEVEVTAIIRGRPIQMFGKITYISELADKATKATRVEVSVDNSTRMLRAGHIVKAKLTRRVLSDVVMIPLSSVISVEDGHMVYIANSETAQPRSLELGIIKGQQVQVIDGLQEGDDLIVKGHRFVATDQPLNVVNASEATNEDF